MFFGFYTHPASSESTNRNEWNEKHINISFIVLTPPPKKMAFKGAFSQEHIQASNKRDKTGNNKNFDNKTPQFIQALSPPLSLRHPLSDDVVRSSAGNFKWWGRGCGAKQSPALAWQALIDHAVWPLIYTYVHTHTHIPLVLIVCMSIHFKWVTLNVINPAIK